MNYDKIYYFGLTGAETGAGAETSNTGSSSGSATVGSEKLNIIDLPTDYLYLSSCPLLVCPVQQFLLAFSLCGASDAHYGATSVVPLKESSCEHYYLKTICNIFFGSSIRLKLLQILVGFLCSELAPMSLELKTFPGRL
jgi:hypothetical protein